MRQRHATFAHVGRSDWVAGEMPVLGGPECSWVIELGSSQALSSPEPIDLKVGVEG